MKTSKSSLLSSFKSKKLLRKEEEGKNPMILRDKEAEKVSAPASTPWALQTPGKAAKPPPRLRHHSAAMSIKEVRQAAQMPRERGSAQTSGNDPELETVKEKERVAKPEKKSTLPEKYELLDEFFNSLDSSIRLLGLKRQATIFTNISSPIQILTDRRFTYSHLAQLMFIMPEAIVVEKELRPDEETMCMKPHLHITLNVEAIDASRSNLRLREVFRGRLLDLFKSNPEGDDIPEEALPEPFCRMKEDPNPVQSSAPSLMTETPDVGTVGQTVRASHLSVSFKSRFSQRGTTLNLENIKQEKASVSVHAFVSESKLVESPSGNETRGIAVDSHSGSMPTSLPETPVKCINPSDIETADVSSTPVDKVSSGSTPVSPLPATPVKCIDLIEGKDQSSFETNSSVLKTPVDHASTPVKLMSATPGLRPPKRCRMSPDDSSSRLSEKLARRPTNRPLTFGSPVKSVKKVDDKFVRSNFPNIYDTLPADSIQPIQENVRLAQMEKDPAISQAKQRKQMFARLHDFFDRVYKLLESIGRITKEELIQRIINNSRSCDIVERKKIEEQLRLLQEFAPEWISEKVGLSGDNIICVNKRLGSEAIRKRLLEEE